VTTNYLLSGDNKLPTIRWQQINKTPREVNYKICQIKEMLEIAGEPMTELLQNKYLILTNETHFAYNVTTAITKK
jgi:hypothetical protein